MLEAGGAPALPNEKPLAPVLLAVGVLLPLPLAGLPKRPLPEELPKRLLEGAPDVGWLDIMKLLMRGDFPTPPGMKKSETAGGDARRDCQPA